MRARSVNKKKGKPSSGRSKLRSRSTSMGHSMRRCSTGGNPGHYKKDCNSKGDGTSKDSEVKQSTKGKLMEDEKGDVYVASKSTKMERESWLINSGASFHMTPHRHWFCEYEELKSGDVLLGDYSLKRIIDEERSD